MNDRPNADLADDTLELRRAGQVYIDSFKGDWKAMLTDLRQRAQKAGREPVTMPPRPPAPKHVPTKRAG